MPIVTVAEAKDHCKVTHDYEDTKFARLIGAAEEWIQNYLNRSELPQTNGVKSAALLIIEGLYKNTSDTLDVQVYPNPAVDR